MSQSLYNLGGLRFWSEDEILAREQMVTNISQAVRNTLRDMNPAWQFARMEGPCLAPASEISEAYDSEDVFVTNHMASGEYLRLRAETTPSSYTYARHLMKNARWAKPPLCVWQVGKSFRRETNDGASAAKLRYNEFYQLEFQCIYRIDTKADYRRALIDVLGPMCQRESYREAWREVPSDRLPSYSESTIDIEVFQSNEKWREVASCSIRKDFAEDMRVCEIAIGLDRLIDLR